MCIYTYMQKYIDKLISQYIWLDLLSHFSYILSAYCQHTLATGGTQLAISINLYFLLIFLLLFHVTGDKLHPTCKIQAHTCAQECVQVCNLMDILSVGMYMYTNICIFVFCEYITQHLEVFINIKRTNRQTYIYVCLYMFV